MRPYPDFLWILTRRKDDGRRGAQEQPSTVITDIELDLSYEAEGAE